MGLQVPCSFHSQISEEVIIWGIKAGDWFNFPRIGKAEKMQSRGGVCDAGSCAYVTQYSSEMFGFQRDWYIKGKSAIHIARIYRGKQRNFAGESFWARGYIRNQEQEDIYLDQLKLF
jgi:hypothetical protein